MFTNLDIGIWCEWRYTGTLSSGLKCNSTPTPAWVTPKLWYAALSKVLSLQLGELPSRDIQPRTLIDQSLWPDHVLRRENMCCWKHPEIPLDFKPTQLHSISRQICLMNNLMNQSKEPFPLSTTKLSRLMWQTNIMLSRKLENSCRWVDKV